MVEGALAGASLEDRLVLSNVGGEAADLDGDGLADLVGRAPVAVYSGASTGSVASDEAIISVDTEGRAWVASGIPDVDGDGFADLVFAWIDDTPRTHPMLLRGPVTGSYTAADADALEGLPRAMYTTDARGVGDLDGDGVDDLSLSQFSDEESALLVFGVGGALVARMDADTSVRVTPNAAGDLDGDGHGDLAVGGYTAGIAGAWILYGPVTGTGALADASSLPGSGDRVSLADVDHDGAIDLLYGWVDGAAGGTLTGSLAIAYGPH